MTADAFQLVVVFTIVPFLPATILVVDTCCGQPLVWVSGFLLYMGYPAVFGACMWVNQSPRKKKET